MGVGASYNTNEQALMKTTQHILQAYWGNHASQEVKQGDFGESDEVQLEQL